MGHVEAAQYSDATDAAHAGTSLKEPGMCPPGTRNRARWRMLQDPAPGCITPGVLYVFDGVRQLSSSPSSLASKPPGK